MTVVVVGDLLLDVDIAGHADRLSPDAPVPVIDIETVDHRPGGAGLAAILLARDGADVALVTALGKDAGADQLRECLAAVQISSGQSAAPTPTKTRVSAAGHPIVRFDQGCEPAPRPGVTPEMLDLIGTAEAILVSDYGRGIASHPAIRSALRARVDSVPIVWDPHPRGSAPVHGISVATPNLAEAHLFADSSGAGLEAAARAGEKLLELWQARSIAVTMGARGALLLDRSAHPLALTAPALEATDACGAGDRFASAVTVALAGGASTAEAVDAGVRAASAFLADGGVGSLNRLPVANPESNAIVAATRARGGVIVAAGGCFDLLHAGHARSLEAARSLGDCLVVCLNSDESVRRLKGPDRPIMSQGDRVELLLSLGCVDAVVVFDEDTPDNALRQLKPDLWVKGGDYADTLLPEKPLVESWGGRVVTVPLQAGRSTTRLASAIARVG